MFEILVSNSEIEHNCCYGLRRCTTNTVAASQLGLHSLRGGTASDEDSDGGYLREYPPEFHFDEISVKKNPYDSSRPEVRSRRPKREQSTSVGCWGHRLSDPRPIAH